MSSFLSSYITTLVEQGNVSVEDISTLTNTVNMENIWSETGSGENKKTTYGNIDVI